MQPDKPITYKEMTEYVGAIQRQLEDRINSFQNWEILADYTLQNNADSFSVPMIKSMKWLELEYYFNRTGGTINIRLNFNNDTGNNYAWRDSANGAADTTTTSTNGMLIMTNTGDQLNLGVLRIYNPELELAQGKSIFGWAVSNASGASVVNNRREITGKWASSDPITSMQFTNYSGTGDFLAGSRVIIKGHN